MRQDNPRVQCSGYRVAGSGQRVPGPGSGYRVPTTRVLFPVLFCSCSSSSLACFCLLFCNSRRGKAQSAQPEATLCSCLVLSCLPLPSPPSHMRGHVVACFVLFTLRFESLSPGKVKTVNEKRETCSGFLTKVKLPSFVCSPHVPMPCHGMYPCLTICPHMSDYISPISCVLMHVGSIYI